MKLNIGCGPRELGAWQGVDIVDYGHNVVADCKALPYDDGSVQQIMAIHLINVIEHWEVPKALREWYRVLKPRGAVRIECPDIIKVLRFFGERGISDPADRYTYGALYGDCKENTRCKWIYAPEHVIEMCKEAGFRDVYESSALFHYPDRDMAIIGVK